jgi:hypothetical protein
MAMKSVGKNLIFKNKKLLSGTWKISHYLGIQEVLDYLSFFFSFNYQLGSLGIFGCRWRFILVLDHNFLGKPNSAPFQQSIA